MPLERRQIAVNFAQGLDTKSDPKQVQGKVLALENGVFTSPGRIKKRNGFRKVGTAVTNAAMVAGYKNELLAADGQNLYSYSSTGAGWQNVGPCRSVRVTRQQVWRESWAYDPSSATIGLVTVTVYLQQDPGSATTNVYYVVDDAGGGLQLKTQTLISASANRGRVVAIGTKFIVLYQKATGIYYRIIDATAPTLLSIEYTLDAAGTAFDASYSSIADRLYVAWANSTTVKIAYFDSTPTLSSPVTIETVSTCTALGIIIDSTGGNPAVAYAINTGPVKYAVLSYTLSITVSATQIEASPGGGSGSPQVTSLIGYLTGGIGSIYYGVQGSSAWFSGFSYAPVWTRSARIVGAIVSAVSTFKRSVIPYSKAYVDSSGVPLFVMAYPFASGSNTNNYACYYLMDSSGSIHARVAQQDAFNNVYFTSPSRGLVVSGTTIACPVSVASRQSTFGTRIVVTSGVDLAVVDLANTTNGYQTAQLGDSLFVNGGMLRQYDGSKCVEQGFHYPPIGLATAAAAGTGLSVGDYYYRAVYEWTDALGQVHQSAPCPPVKLTISSGANQAATITVPTLGITDKTNVVVRIYRTLVNSNVYYMVNGPWATLTYSDPTVDTVTYSDTTTDTSLAASQMLYTQSEVDNLPGPPMDNMVVYRNRLMGTWSEQPNAIWYSKQVVPGTAVAFNDTFVQNIDPTNGAVTALGWMDDKLAVFKRDVIFYMTGTGPAPDGTQNDFSTPIVINTNSGCITPKSVVTADDGVMYQSAKGIYLLTRGLEDQYIGAGVEAYNGASVVGAVMAPNTNEVRFALNSGVVLTWDYFVKQWSTFTFDASPSIAGACTYRNLFAYVAAGQVWYEFPGTYRDHATTFALKVKTAWIQLAGLQGYQRAYKVLLLGDYGSAHTLNAKVYYDFDSTTASQSSTFTASATAPYQYRLFLARQKCEALQLEIYDSAQASSYEGFDLSAVALEVGVKRGLNKMASARSA